MPQKGYKVIVLDSIIRDHLTSNGRIDDEQLKWLDNELDNSKKDTVLIFMHVPIVEPFESVGHRLLNAAEVQEVIEKHKNPIAVFQGHYHAAMIRQHDQCFVCKHTISCVISQCFSYNYRYKSA